MYANLKLVHRFWHTCSHRLPSVCPVKKKSQHSIFLCLLFWPIQYNSTTPYHIISIAYYHTCIHVHLYMRVLLKKETIQGHYILKKWHFIHFVMEQMEKLSSRDYNSANFKFPYYLCTDYSCQNYILFVLHYKFITVKHYCNHYRLWLFLLVKYVKKDIQF